ncbi:hypothetical protein FB107DRAFT_280258 [Schizophyllum commune]
MTPTPARRSRHMMCHLNKPPEACAGILGFRMHKQERLVEDFDQVLGVIERICAACEPPEACAGSLGDVCGNSVSFSAAPQPPEACARSLGRDMRFRILEVPEDACDDSKTLQRPFLTSFSGSRVYLRDPRTAGGMRAAPRMKDADAGSEDDCTREGNTRSQPRSGESTRGSRSCRPRPCHAAAVDAPVNVGESLPTRGESTRDDGPSARRGGRRTRNYALARPRLAGPATSDERRNAAGQRGYAAGLRPDTTKSSRHVALPPPRASEERGTMPSASTHVTALTSPTPTANPSVQSPRSHAEGTRHVPLDRCWPTRGGEAMPVRVESPRRGAVRPPCCQTHVPDAAFYLATEPISASSGVYTCEGEGEGVKSSSGSEGEGEEIETSSGSEGVRGTPLAHKEPSDVADCVERMPVGSGFREGRWGGGMRTPHNSRGPPDPSARALSPR